MSKSIAVFGAGPGLGQAVARRYAQDGYEVVLVARRREPLELFAQELADVGASAHVITADLADTDAVPVLAQQIRHIPRPGWLSAPPNTNNRGRFSRANHWQSPG